MDEFEKSKVYIQTDSADRVLRCEGGYTMSNIADISEWIYIDEGTGDRYNLCQSHYFEGGLYTEDGYCRYVYDNGECRLRTEEEIGSDRESNRDKAWTAPHFLDPGDCITVEGNLYKVLLPILSGSQITIGTNVKETSIEAEIGAYDKTHNSQEL